MENKKVVVVAKDELHPAYLSAFKNSGYNQIVYIPSIKSKNSLEKIKKFNPDAVFDVGIAQYDNPNQMISRYKKNGINLIYAGIDESTKEIIFESL